MMKADDTAPTGHMLGRVAGLARGLSDVVPGGALLRERLTEAEQQMLLRLRQRLDEVDGGQAAPHALPSGARSGSLADRYQALVEQSMEQTPDSATEAYFGQLLAELVPDEVRILNAASDGKAIAVLHVDTVTRMGGPSRLFSNLSRVGTEAGVMLNDLTPSYLAHLLGMGLLRPGPVSTGATNAYDMLENDADLLRRIERLATERKAKPRMVRASLQLSKLGEDFLRACGVLAA